MRMTVLELECNNIRKLSSLKLFFHHNDEAIKNNFVMMANGTGKTTIIQLIKGLLDGSAVNWSSEKIKEFAPSAISADLGEFSLTVKFDNRQYKYILSLNYKNGTAKIDTVVPPRGRESGLRLPEALRGIFTSEFVSRFVFDGEQAKKSMDRTSNEAEETIRYLYRLDELDSILAMNIKILLDIQNAEGGSKGTNSSISNLRTRKEAVEKAIVKLEKEQRTLNADLSAYQAQLKEKQDNLNELHKQSIALNQEKQGLIKEAEENRGKISSQVNELLVLVKSPYLLSDSFSERMLELGRGMQKLKLPKNSSKDFFIELANADKCICDRCIGETERDAILKNAERYLGGDQQAVLNIIKSCLIESNFDSSAQDAFNVLVELRKQAENINKRATINEEKLLKAGGDKAEQLQEEIDKLYGLIAVAQASLKRIESKDEFDEKLDEQNNLHKAKIALDDYEKKIASATRTNNALRRKAAVEKLILAIKEKATEALKAEIIRKTNEKIKKVITDDNIEIENIDRYIKLRNRNGASEGQTLSIGYCFLGTLFEDAELEFPFIIDSPTGKMDFDKRKAVAAIIPKVFNQMIAFVQSAEVDRFADRFYYKDNTQFLTVIAPKDGSEVEIHKGEKYFDSYQQEHKGEVE